MELEVNASSGQGVLIYAFKLAEDLIFQAAKDYHRPERRERERERESLKEKKKERERICVLYKPVCVNELLIFFILFYMYLYPFVSRVFHRLRYLIKNLIKYLEREREGGGGGARERLSKWDISIATFVSKETFSYFLTTRTCKRSS